MRSWESSFWSRGVASGGSDGIYIGHLNDANPYNGLPSLPDADNGNNNVAITIKSTLPDADDGNNKV